MTAIQTVKNNPGQNLIIGEGERDRAFLSALCAVRRIGNLRIDEAKGSSKFGKYLDGLKGQSGFAKLENILIVGDNDETAGKNFRLIKDQLNDAGFPSPPRPLEIAKKKNLPSVGVLMMPYPAIDGSDSGCLETLLIPAMQDAHLSHAECVDSLITCVNSAAWPKKSSRDKLKVRCLISVVHHDDPMHGLPWCFSQDKGLIPLDHDIFNPVADVLQNFVAWAKSDIPKWVDWKSANP